MVHYKKVKKAMIDKDLTTVKLSEITGFSRVHISNVINGHFEAPRARKAIADALGMDFNELWDGQPNRH